MFTVVETGLFQAQWPLYWSEDERAAFATYISNSPNAGKLVPGSGGIRKVRWKLEGTGKSGGVRIVYYTRTPAEEVVLLLIYAKAATDNITGARLKEIRRALES
jgi:hypothetical protein